MIKLNIIIFICFIFYYNVNGHKGTSQKFQYMFPLSKYPGETPYEAFIVCTPHYCSGTLIHPLWTLSSGTCLVTKTQCTKVIIGAVNEGQKNYTVTKIVPHPELWYTEKENLFNPFVINDIGLVKLDETSDLSFMKMSTRRFTTTEKCTVPLWYSSPGGLYLKRLKVVANFINNDDILDEEALKVLGMNYSTLGITLSTNSFPSIDDIGTSLICNHQLVAIFSSLASNDTHQFKMWTYIDKYVNWIYDTITSDVAAPPSKKNASQRNIIFRKIKRQKLEEDVTKLPDTVNPRTVTNARILVSSGTMLSPISSHLFFISIVLRATTSLFI